MFKFTVKGEKRKMLPGQSCEECQNFIDGLEMNT